jgi:hypothetical protein
MLFRFVLANVILVFLYYTRYLGVDDEEFGRTELMQEGFMSSFGLFVVRILLLDQYLGYYRSHG